MLFLVCGAGRSGNVTSQSEATLGKSESSSSSSLSELLNKSEEDKFPSSATGCGAANGSPRLGGGNHKLHPVSFRNSRRLRQSWKQETVVGRYVEELRLHSWLQPASEAAPQQVFNWGQNRCLLEKGGFTSRFFGQHCNNYFLFSFTN